MKTFKKTLAIVLTLALLLTATIGFSATGFAAPAGTKLTDLKVNNMERPYGVDELPYFGWTMESNVIGAEQSAYQIIVKKADGAQVWDSGKVSSGISQFIEYKGPALTAKTDYTFEVTVWDAAGDILKSDPCAFSTGLMDTSLAAWKGAQYVGAPDRALAADALAVFYINSDFQLSDGSVKGGFVLGANNPLLNKAVYNNNLLEGENYIYYEIDYSALIANPSTGQARVNVYRKGYRTTDKDAQGNNKVTYIAYADVARTVINDTNMYGKHAMQITCGGMQLGFSIDGGANISFTRTADGTATGSGANIVFTQPRATTPDSAPTGDAPAFPRLCNVGFSAGADSAIIISNYRIRNHRAPNATLFSASVGAKYNIWKGKPNTLVSTGSVVVAGDTEDNMIYADPSSNGVPYVKTKLNLKDEVVDARAYVTCRGVYELYANGQRIEENEYFNPGYTQYPFDLRYYVYDVADFLNKGDNVFGAIMSSGWWGDEQTFTMTNNNVYGDNWGLMAMVDVTYADGSKETFVTNTDTWKAYTDGPIRYSGLFHGENYDARKEANVEGWNTVGYDDSKWTSAVEIHGVSANVENPHLSARIDSPAHLFETLTAKGVESQTRKSTTVYIYDMGENMVGVPSIKLPQLAAGTKVTIRYGEVKYPELAASNPYNYGEMAGMILTENYRQARSTDFYIAKGTPGGETFQPSFTFHGYRYIEISGEGINATTLPIENVKGRVICSLDEIRSEYEGSNALANRLFLNIRRSTLGNHLSIPTDCNQRNERMGWSGDAQVFAHTASYMTNIDGIYNNWAYSLRGAQLTSTSRQYVGMGGTPSQNTTNNYDNVAVYNPNTAATGSICWPFAGIAVAWETYCQYNNIPLLKAHFDSMDMFLNAYNLPGAKIAGYTYLVRAGGLSEHLAVDDTNTNFNQNITYMFALRCMEKMATAIGRTDKAEYYGDMFRGAKAEFNEFCIKEGKAFGVSPAAELVTQAGYSMPLYYDMVDDADIASISNYLEQYCAKGPNSNPPAGITYYPYTISTGFVGTKTVLPALTKTGKVDTAYKMFEQTKYPSWLYPVTQGATSIWERWNSITAENGFSGNNSMNSFNHYAMGAVGEWMMNTHVGISRDDETPGFKHFILQPTPGGSFTYANGSYDSIYGDIVSNWTADASGLKTYHTEIPANTGATIYLPVAESAMAGFVAPKGITYQGMEIHNGNLAAKFEGVAGGYDFEIVNGKLVASVADGYVKEATSVGVKAQNGKVVVGSAAKFTVYGNFDQANVFEIKGTYTGDVAPTFTPANGLTIVGTPQVSGGQIHIIVGKANQYLSGEQELIAFSFPTSAAGTITLNLTEAAISGATDISDDDTTYEVPAKISPASATITIYASTKDICDLNGDGKVSAADLSLAMKYYGAQSGDSNWAAAQKCDVTGDGLVDMADLIMILANYTTTP